MMWWSDLLLFKWRRRKNNKKKNRSTILCRYPLKCLIYYITKKIIEARLQLVLSLPYQKTKYNTTPIRSPFSLFHTHTCFPFVILLHHLHQYSRVLLNSSSPVATTPQSFSILKNTIAQFYVSQVRK